MSKKMKVSRHRLTLKTSKAEIQEERIGKIDREKGKGFYVTPARMNSKEMFRGWSSHFGNAKNSSDLPFWPHYIFRHIRERERVPLSVQLSLRITVVLNLFTNNVTLPKLSL